ncbi:unnamed protein product [Somion occarium]|uniref:Smr domain-containing protein n=1 Tax=Somion occarium TaxID=3059160 RepID=A0ABP1DJ43_9APHY
MSMDSLLSIGVGLGLRPVIDNVTHNPYRASALIGLWEGVVLNHFLVKFPRSVDPYVAFGFRLFVDFLFTESFLRMTIIVLWTGLGLVFADLGRDLTNDRRFRRLWRRIRRLVLKPTLGLLPASSLSRVRFLQVPAGSTSSVVSRSTARSPTSATSSFSLRVPLRPSTRPVPGSFDQWSEVSTDIGRDIPQRAPSPPPRPAQRAPPPPLTLYPQPMTRPRPESEAEPYPYPSPSRSPSELEYVALPMIPDQPSSPLNRRDHYMRSGLTTPNSNPTSNEYDEEDRPYIHSGLTTPYNQRRPLTSEGLPPVRIIDDGTEYTPTRSQVELPPIPIRPPPQGSNYDTDDNEHIEFPIPHLSALGLSDPQPSHGFVPPMSEIPNIPTQDDHPEGKEGDDANKRDTLVDPPPRYESVAEVEPVDVPDHVSVAETEADSVITEGPKDAVIQRAESLRKDAQAKEKQRDELRQKMLQAQKDGEYFKALKYEVELEEAHTSAQKLHAQARRRFFLAHNMQREPQEIDVHRLSVAEALAAVKTAIRDAYDTNAPELRIIVGKGKHSKNNIPVLKLAIVGELQKHHIEAVPQHNNAGVLVITLDRPSDEAGPSDSAS